MCNLILSLSLCQTPSPPPGLYLVQSHPAATEPHMHNWIQKVHTRFYSTTPRFPEAGPIPTDCCQAQPPRQSKVLDSPPPPPPSSLPLLLLSPPSFHPFWHRPVCFPEWNSEVRESKVDHWGRSRRSFDQSHQVFFCLFVLFFPAKQFNPTQRLQCKTS